MTSRSPLDAWSKYFDQANVWLAWIGGVAMFFMAAVIMVGVVMRYIVQQPMLGLNETIQMTAVVLVMSALPYSTQTNTHVRVDVFDSAIGVWGRFFGDLLYRAVAIFVLSILVQRAGLKALDALEWGDSTNMLRMLTWPFYAILAAGSALCVVVLATQALIVIVERFRK